MLVAYVTNLVDLTLCFQSWYNAQVTTSLPVLLSKKPDNCRGKKVACRPCPYAYQCRYHMFDIIKGDGAKTDDELVDILLDLPVTCMWDVWQHGEAHSLIVVGRWFRVTGSMIANTVREVVFKAGGAAHDDLRKVYETFYTDKDDENP